mgnify:FL=1
MGSLKVVLADDHRLTAGALSDSLRGHGVEVSAVVHTASEALEAVRQHRPDVLITDLDMGPGPSGVDVAIRVKQIMARIGVVVLTAYEDPKLLSSKMPTLPKDVVYLVKHQIAEISDLLAAILTAYRYSTGELAPPKTTVRFALTDAQASLLRLVAQGLSNQAIADELQLTTGSVTVGINRLAKKLGVSSSDATNVRAALTQRYFDYVGFQRES